MATMTPWVRQYSLRDLLDDSFDLFKARITPLVLAAVIPSLLVVLYIAIMRLVVFPGTWDVAREAELAAAGDYHAVISAHTGYLLGLSAVSMLATAIGYIVQCRIATWYALGRTDTLRQAFRALLKPIASLIPIAIFYGILFSAVAGVAYVVAAIIGALTYLIATIAGSTISTTSVTAIVVMICFFLAYTFSGLLVSTLFLTMPVALAVEHCGPFTAIGKGFKLATSNFKAHCVTLLIYILFPLPFSALVAVLIALLTSATSTISPTVTLTVGSVVAGLGQMVLLGLFASFQSLAYLDGQCRKEQLDLRVLAQQLGLDAEFAQSITPSVSPVYPNYAAPAATVVATPSPTAFPDYSAPPPPLAPEEQQHEGDTDAC